MSHAEVVTSSLGWVGASLLDVRRWTRRYSLAVAGPYVTCSISFRDSLLPDATTLDCSVRQAGFQASTSTILRTLSYSYAAATWQQKKKQEVTGIL